MIAIAADRSSSSCLLRESLTVICRRQRMVFMLAAASRRPGAARRPGERKGDERAHRQPKMCARRALAAEISRRYPSLGRPLLSRARFTLDICSTTCVPARHTPGCALIGVWRAKKRPRACQPHRRSPVHRLRARHAAAAPHSHLSKVYSHLKTAEWRLTRRPSARRARAERACPSQLPLALPAARGPQGRCVGHCCCATPLVLVDTRASRAAFAAVPKRCSARRDTARWSGIRAAMPLSLRESTRATSRTRHAIGRQRRSRR